MMALCGVGWERGWMGAWLDGSVVGWERCWMLVGRWMGALLDVGGRVRWRRCCDVDGVVELLLNDG